MNPLAVSGKRSIGYLPLGAEYEEALPLWRVNGLEEPRAPP
jgi:hypothetical protein